MKRITTIRLERRVDSMLIILCLSMLVTVSAPSPRPKIPSRRRVRKRSPRRTPPYPSMSWS